MRILYIHQYFITPAQPGGTRSYWIGQKLVEQGVNVTIITSDQEGKLTKPETRVIDGMKVIYLPNKYDNKMSFVKRLISFLSFMTIATRYALKEKDIDLVFATSTPLTIGVPALLKKWLHKTPFVFEVRDLWPEVPIQMGALDNKILRGGALFLEKIIYKNALHVVTLSPGMDEGVLRFAFMKGKTSMIPNMSKVDEFFPREKSDEIYSQFGLDPTVFNIVHFGAMGIANGLEYIAEAALEAKKNGEDDFHFHFLGAGIAEDDLLAFKKDHALSNLHLHGRHNMETVSAFVNCCDISMVSFKNLPILSTNSPNKLFDSLSAGIPILVNSNGWTKDLVENHNCGRFTDPTRPAHLIEVLKELKQDPDLLIEMGKNGRLLAENTYDKSLLTTEMSVLLQSFISE